MRDYTDLIKRLRSVKDTWQSEEEQWMLDAADSIEELAAYKKIATDEHNRAAKMAWEHRWIPVTERLPDEYQDVLCYYEYFRYGEYNCIFRTIDKGYYGNGLWGGEAGRGYKNKVLYWMPLPEPPKMGGAG